MMSPADVQENKVEEVEEAIQEMLARLDEFCGVMDVIRNQTSQLLGEESPEIQAKIAEIRSIYTRVDKLEAFVDVVRHHVSFLEDQLIRAEKEHQAFPHMVQKMLQSVNIPYLKKKYVSPKQEAYELPKLYRTEDIFPMSAVGSKNQKT
ncbi:breast carcinoma-amplified sequence 4 [Rhinatrema bivittatum]|uniref:breast carcinoma-amplified sequence 4 n=1 Tax=Rhinatrema bivittatum TaxID=194408 RepID=UPI00112A8D5E|nr:breast carcinoma-amplified sequence 4 [Rhinatrema bivittatum]XP_029469453.1 breast carcinoma-amplified sequence 4 [Rhinatrema bivittatum]XP_029469454.1 breast carcinoma-amplified sequence 4 [Rhinatrema bivittatum]XP_029469455.1 breast carcinoma-amplified sequence 4 [Rhinatrema bivittatum]